MIDIINAPPEHLTLSKRYIAEELKQRGGWQAFVYHELSANMRLIRPDGKVLELYGTTPPKTSLVMASRSDDKFVAYHLFSEHAIPTPITYLFQTFEALERQFSGVQLETAKWVVKPLDAGHGNGISVGVQGVEELRAAMIEAKKFHNAVLVQELIPNAFDLRITIIDYTCVGAVLREPAHVVGDGTHTIEQLIHIENQKPERGENYSKKLNKIDYDAAVVFLKDKIRTVPSLHAKVQVLGVANVGKGGTLVDLEGLLPEWLKQLAENVAKVMELPVCGVDILVTAVPSPHATIENLNPSVIEVNRSPAMFITDIARPSGERTTTKSFIDYLERI